MSIIYCSLKKFTNDENGEICAICRKNLKKNDLIIQCPNCSTFFHHNHLQEWLKTNSVCPVCKNTLIVLISEDEAINDTEHTKDDNLDILKIDGVLKEDNKMVFYNPILKPKIPSIVVQILIIVTGFMFLFFSLINPLFEINFSNFQLLTKSWREILCVLPFFLSSCFIIFLGFTKDKIFFSNNWQNLELNSSRIVVTSKRIPKKIELFPDKIKSILIETYEDELEGPDGILEDMFCLRLEISYKKGKKYYFERIFEEISSTKTERIVQMLEEFLMEKHSIQISAFSDEMKKKKEKIRILYISIGSILLMSILLIITSFWWF